jgi:hypothetical protein
MQEDVLEENNLINLIKIILSYKVIISGIVGFFFLVSVLFFLFSTPQFQSKVVVISNAEEGGAGGSMAALSSILDSGGGFSGSSHNSVNAALVKLQSPHFLKGFLIETGLLKELFTDNWNDEDNSWLPNSEPTLGQIKRLSNKVFTIQRDPKKGIITLIVTHPNKDLVFSWASLIVPKLNEVLRNEVVEESKRSIAYLEEESKGVNFKEMRNIIFADIMKNQVEILMSANSKKEFLFKVIDPPIYPESKISPILYNSILVGLILGIFMAIFFALMANFFKEEKIFE